MLFRLPIIVVNHLVLNLRSYSHPHHELGLVTSSGSALSDVRFHYSKTLGNIGAPLDFGQGTDPSVADGREIGRSEVGYEATGRHNNASRSFSSSA